MTVKKIQNQSVTLIVPSMNTSIEDAGGSSCHSEEHLCVFLVWTSLHWLQNILFRNTSFLMLQSRQKHIRNWLTTTGFNFSGREKDGTTWARKNKAHERKSSEKNGAFKGASSQWQIYFSTVCRADSFFFLFKRNEREIYIIMIRDQTLTLEVPHWREGQRKYLNQLWYLSCRCKAGKETKQVTDCAKGNSPIWRY